MPVIGFDRAFGRLKLSEVHKNESGDRHLSGSKTFFSPINFFESISSAHLLSCALIRITWINVYSKKSDNLTLISISSICVF